MSIRPRRHNTAVTLLAAALACAGLEACQNPADATARGLPAENWEGPQLKTEPELQITEYRQDVRFIPGSASLAPGTEDALMAFRNRRPGLCDRAMRCRWISHQERK